MKTVYFISPHLDDAFFSTGALMMQLISQKNKVVIVNVFTAAGTLPQTLSAKTFLKQIGLNSSANLYRERVTEDKTVFTKIGAKVINLNEVEALWRKKKKPNTIEKIIGQFLPETLHVYPIYRLQIINGHISKLDTKLIQEIAKKITELTLPGDIIFCPIGIGGHVDHLVIRAACESLTKRSLVYWADIPYKDRANQAQTQLPTSAKSTQSITDLQLLAKKDKIAQGYKTQYIPVFGTKGCGESIEEYYADSQTLAQLFS